MYSSLEMETAASNGVGMSLTRTVFIDINVITGAVYKESRIPPHESGTTNTKVVDATMWSVPEMHLELELLYGNKCRCGVFGGMAHVS